MFKLVHIIVRDEGIYSYLYEYLIDPLLNVSDLTIRMALLCVAHLCVSRDVLPDIGLMVVALLVENPSLLAIVGCRMLNDMKQTGAKSLHQAEGQSFCYSKSTLPPIEFTEFTPQSGLHAEPPKIETRSLSRLDTDTLV